MAKRTSTREFNLTVVQAVDSGAFRCQEYHVGEHATAGAYCSCPHPHGASLLCSTHKLHAPHHRSLRCCRTFRHHTVSAVFACLMTD